MQLNITWNVQFVIRGDIITEKIYKNKNGNMDLIDFVMLVHTEKINQWMRDHRLNLHPCPPEKLLRGRECACFYCVDCTKYAISKIKEYKSYYQIGKIKISKEELING